MTPAGRPKARNSWYPPNVGCNKYGFYLDRRSTKEWVRLKDASGQILRPNAAQSDVWVAYERLSKEVEFTVNTLIDRYLECGEFKQLKANTQRDYIQWSTHVRLVFGEMQPDTITSPHVRMFLNARGATYPTAANHERSFIGIIMTWGKGLGYVNIANPCTGVKPIKTKSKARAPEDIDYRTFYDLLIDSEHPFHAAAMEIAYLCGSRQQDVLRLYDSRPIRPKENDCYVTSEGIVIWQEKTGKVQLKEFTPRLKAAVELARKHKKQGKRRKSSPWLICTRSGTKYTRSGFNATWGRMQREAEEKGMFARFRFHDLKHKGITDYEGDKQQFSGHKSRSMMERYNHGIDRVSTVDKPMNVDK